MMPGLRRARMLGAGLAVMMFGAGVLVGARFFSSPAAGPRLIVTATDQMPAELERLGLTPAQRSQLVGVIRQGRDRVIRVVDAFDPQMQAAVDSTDREVRAILDSVQRAAFDSARRANGPPLRRQRIRAPEAGGPSVP